MTYQPILLIKYNPEQFEVTGYTLSELNNFFIEKFPDYHVFCYPERIDKNFEFELLNARNITKAKYKRLTTLISKSIELIKK